MGADFCCTQQSDNTKLPLVHSKAAFKPEVKIKLQDIFMILMDSKNKKLSMNDFQKIGTLGQGGYGKVYLVQEKANHEKGIEIQYAMKVIPKRLVYEKRLYDQLINQKQILADVKHHFLIDLIYAFQDKINCYFVMEFASGGDAYSLISHLPKHAGKVQAFKSLGQNGARFIMACVVLGIECLHEHNLVYRDLKPENVLLFKDGYVKLTDFGLSKRIEDGDKSNSLAGTKLYLAPEVVQRKGHDRLVDLWALGIFLNELLGLDEPFEPQWIVKGRFMKMCLSIQKKRNWGTTAVSEEAKDLIKKLMKVVPQNRLGANGFDEIKKHPFFNSIDWQKLMNMELQSPLKSIVQKYPVRARMIRETHIKDDEDFPRIQGLTFEQKNKLFEGHCQNLIWKPK